MIFLPDWPARKRRSFVNGYNAAMRWRLIIGVILFILSLGIGLVTLLYPETTTSRLTVSLTPEIEAEIQIKTPVRAWVADKTSYTLQSVIENGSAQSAPLTLSARLEMGDVDVNPQGLVNEIVTAGGGVKFTWSVRPPQAGKYPGILWLFEKNGTSAETLVLAREVELTSVKTFWVSPILARLAALILFSVSLGLLFSFWKHQRHP